MEEIRRILQSGATVGSPARTFLGMSPPARCSDGIVHDAAWHRRNCRGPQNFCTQVRPRVWLIMVLVFQCVKMMGPWHGQCRCARPIIPMLARTNRAFMATSICSRTEGCS